MQSERLSTAACVLIAGFAMFFGGAVMGTVVTSGAWINYEVAQKAANK